MGLLPLRRLLQALVLLQLLSLLRFSSAAAIAASITGMHQYGPPL